MKTIYALLLSALLAAPAFAGAHKIPKEAPIASITFPSGWKVEDSDESIDATSDDGEIYINVELNDSDSIEGAIEESFGYLKKNKVTVDPDSKKQTEGEINGLKGIDFSFDGKDADGPCKISLTVLQVSEKKGLLILYWASPEGEKKHDAELGKIMQSLKAIK
jgi:predicted Zn-dependent protease